MIFTIRSLIVPTLRVGGRPDAVCAKAVASAAARATNFIRRAVYRSCGIALISDADGGPADDTARALPDRSACGGESRLCPGAGTARRARRGGEAERLYR